MIEIILLSQPSCHYCDYAKEILSRLSQESALSIREIGLETNEGRALALQHAVMFAPGVILDNKLFSYGRLSEKKLRHHLSQSGIKQMEGKPT